MQELEKTAKRGNIIAEIYAIDESTDEDGGEAARSAWSDVLAFFVQRFGEAGAKIHKLSEIGCDSLGCGVTNM